MKALTILLQAQGDGGLGMILMLVAMFAIMYFFMIRPQQKKQKEIQKFRNSIERGQEVITAGGIYGVVRDIDEVKNSIQSMSYNGDGDDDYPFDSLQSLISVAPYKHIAVIGDSEFNFSAEDSQVITDLCKEYGKDWAFFDTGGVRTIWWTADPSYVVEDEDAELCYMDAGGYHRTYLKANQGPAMFVLAYIPSGKIHEVIGMSPNSSAAAYKWPYFGPDLTNMHTANGSGGQNYDGAPFSTSWYGGLYDNYGTPKDPVEWSYIPQMTIDVPMGDRQGVLDAVAEAAGLQVSFSEVEGWYKSSVG